MKEANVSRIALIFALAFIAMVALAIAMILIETFLKMPNAADWAAAIGGFLAVAAAAIIAIHQSQQTRRSLEAQSALARETLENQTQLHQAGIAAQEALTKASLKSQERLQQATFDFQRQAAIDQISREREVAIGTINTAYVLISSVVRNIPDEYGPDKHFINLWTEDAELAIQLCRSVQYGHLKSEDLRAHGTICILISDAWTAVKDATNAEDDESRQELRAWAKTRVNDCRGWLRTLDASWSDPRGDELILTTAEQATAKWENATTPPPPPAAA